MADIAVTAANVRSSASTPIQRGVIKTSVTITQGQPIYLDTATGTYGLADSNGTSPANTVAGIAVSAGSGGQSVLFVSTDSAFTSGATLVSGDVIYLSNTAGRFTNDATDLATGSTVIVLGVVNTDLTLNLNPTTGGVTS